MHADDVRPEARTLASKAREVASRKLMEKNDPVFIGKLVSLIEARAAVFASLAEVVRDLHFQSHSIVESEPRWYVNLLYHASRLARAAIEIETQLDNMIQELDRLLKDAYVVDNGASVFNLYTLSALQEAIDSCYRSIYYAAAGESIAKRKHVVEIGDEAKRAMDRCKTILYSIIDVDAHNAVWMKTEEVAAKAKDLRILPKLGNARLDELGKHIEEEAPRLLDVLLEALDSMVDMLYESREDEGKEGDK